MKEDEGVQVNEETKDTQSVQESPPQTQAASVDYKALYLDEVQTAKKLRKRAQDAEKSVQKTMAERETQKVEQMKEQEKYKELYESVAPFKEKWETHESNRREALLSKLPEGDRESLSQKDLDTLEYIVGIQEKSKTVNPSHVPAQSRNLKETPKDWTKLSADELRDNWDNILENAMNKNQNQN